jgi:uncharacterized protein (TIGR02145 family)
MKKTFFFFAMLASVAASAQVTNVEPIGANYANKTVSFRVWWNAGSRNATHLAKVWVWVDYITVNSNNTTSGNTWTRATVGTVSGGITSYDGTNRKGFWLEGNASTNYSATLTVQLTNVSDKFNWCTYASDYPPNVTANNSTYTFKGTPPFTLIAANGTTQTVTGKTLATSALTITPTTIKDKTECPGIFCIYTGSDLYIDATHLCQQRTSGAKNWEAYIKDARDNKIYRIVQMSDGNWYFAQDLDYRDGSDYLYNTSYCTTYIYGVTAANGGAVCPSSWDVPTTAVWTQLINTIDGGANNWAAFWPTSSGGTDIYGFTAVAHGYWISYQADPWYRASDTGTTAWRIYWTRANKCEMIVLHKYEGRINIICSTLYPPAFGPIRCFRQL